MTSADEPEDAPPGTPNLRIRILRAVNDVVWGSLAIWLATLAAALTHPSAMVVGLAFVVVVLVVSVWRGLLAGTAASIVGVGVLNYYYIPPVGWAIHSRDDIVALASFLIASTVASRLVVVARRRAAESEARGREVRVLYDLSVELFATRSRDAVPAALDRAFRRLGIRGGSLLVTRDGDRRSFSAFGRRPPSADDLRIQEALAAGRTLASGGSSGLDLDIPLFVDGVPAGVLSVRGAFAARNAVDSAARLVALAFERERFLTERLHLEALKESDALKTSLLRAVSHDLRTPLTAIRLKIETLRRLVNALPQGAEALGTMTREVENLKHRIDNLLSMARLQAGMSVPRPEPSPPADLFRAAREGLESILEGRPVQVAVADDCPDVLVDPSLAVEVLINLLENAAHAAPAESPLELRADSFAGAVRLSVLDRGPGLPASGPDLVSSGGHSGPETTGGVRRGLGLEIARGLAAASGGSITFDTRPGGGTIASITLPAFQPPDEAERSEVRTA